MNKLRPSSEVIEIIKNRMKELNLNQKEIAEKTGVSTSAISRYFNGSRDFPINDAPVFAKVLNIDLNYLLGIKTIDDLNLTGIERIAASHRDDEFTEEDLEDIQKYIDFVKAKRKNND
jgi:transcriptional regulator with XRE-family HTH domain